MPPFGPSNKFPAKGSARALHDAQYTGRAGVCSPRGLGKTRPITAEPAGFCASPFPAKRYHLAFLRREKLPAVWSLENSRITAEADGTASGQSALVGFLPVIVDFWTFLDFWAWCNRGRYIGSLYALLTVECNKVRTSQFPFTRFLSQRFSSSWATESYGIWRSANDHQRKGETFGVATTQFCGFFTWPHHPLCVDGKTEVCFEIFHR